MLDDRVRIGDGGRVVIPAAYRKAIGVRPGDDLVIRLDEGELRLFRQAKALNRIRAAVKRRGRKGGHTTDFLNFRREDEAG